MYLPLYMVGHTECGRRRTGRQRERTFMSDFGLLIDGRIVPGDMVMSVINPATEEVLAECPRASKDQLNAAVAAAKAAFPAWAATPIDERRKLVLKMADVIEANADELARLLTSEQGKPLAAAALER